LKHCHFETSTLSGQPANTDAGTIFWSRLFSPAELRNEEAFFAPFASFAVQALPCKEKPGPLLGSSFLPLFPSVILSEAAAREASGSTVEGSLPTERNT